MTSTNKRQVGVLRDFSYAERPGEDELAAERLLRAAPDSVELTICPPGHVSLDKLREVDTILSFGLKRYPDEVLDFLAERAPAQNHVHVAQDWWAPLQPQSRYRNWIIEGASIVCFSSPLHLKRHRDLYGVHNDATFLIPPPLEKSDYTRPDSPNGAPPSESALWAAPWHPDYGNDLLIVWAEEHKENVDVFGLGVQGGDLSPHVKGKGAIAPDAALATMSAYSQFVYFPRHPAPFGFMFMLAYLAGLEVTYSGGIGCLSYEGGITDQLVEKCESAAETFWEVAL